MKDTKPPEVLALARANPMCKFLFICALGAGLAPLARGQVQIQYGPVQLPPGYPSPDAPWPEAEAKGLWPKSAAQPTPPASAAQQPVPQPPVEPTTPPSSPPPQGMFTTAPSLRAPKPTKHEVAVSGDFLLGQGQVTLPIGYSLKQAGLPQIKPIAASASRSSDYYGGTLSYSYGQAWYVDLSYVKGKSSGDQAIDYGSLGHLNSAFSIDDQWYQGYVRYTFPGLRGKRLSAYIRAGATYVTATLDATSVEPTRYAQNDKTDDILGNLGFGFAYQLYNSRHLRLRLQLEGEGFYGTRSQKSTETLGPDFQLSVQTADINNTLYGGIGRVTVGIEYRIGRSGLFKAFADGGFQGRYTKISYPDASAPNELLYGPYVKVGLRYAF